MVTPRKQNIIRLPGLTIASQGKAWDTGWDDPAALDDLLPGKKGSRQTSQVRQPPGRLLVIDDSKTAREDLISLLENKGHSVLTAKNGLEGLRVLDRHPEIELLLCDLVMPVLDGLGVLKMLAGRGDLRRHPVMILSSLDEMQGVVSCLTAGAMDFVRKPFFPEEMALRVRNTLALTRTLNNLSSLAHRDPLTGLFNHRVFVEMLQRELSRSRRSGAPLGLLFADLDRFKLVNDRYGHLVGDEVLKEFSRRVQQEARRSDLVARYGGEEFTVVAPEADWSGLYTLAQRIRQAMEEPCATSAGPVMVTVSIGGAVYDPSQDQNPDHNRLLSQADRALYIAKDAGRNRVEISQNDLPLLN
ncbi:MAG: diguanylate cyclase [Desulfarculaceae bacterium]|nr:diguanylate cyclase [Desulfarculaceae bacterium]MCF8046573.1 diguanylate cyclase [Desulfarculaceae bacterium]MCF8065102.1 diguanylate cyclase [Desulfarculaceae bacterium]MCF8099150.1 diguanylate cyclase [Desulfarculaceae bacterium]MCF8120928.1 diguanylate cyclase [Desulfarculaceae bacterium]